MSWGDKKEVQKGNIGERIVEELLIKWGYIIYKVVNDGPHIIDFFAHKSDKDIIGIDAKTKRRLKLYTRTGFNYKNYLEYEKLQKQHNLRIFMLFVDDFEGYAYGQWLDKLGEGYIMDNYEKVIVWGLDKMKIIRELTEDEVMELNKYTTENWDYSKINKYFGELSDEEKDILKNW